MKYLISIIFLALVAVGCSTNSEKNLQKSLYDEVMLAHDEVMPEMGSLMKLTKQLKAKSDSIEDKNDQEIVLQLIEDLELANESMMNWMRQFEPIEEGTPHGEVIEYLTDQKEKIEKVKDDMLSSKENAEEYLLKN